jgi:hypothetical protein
VVQVDLRRQTLLTLDTNIDRCKGNDQPPGLIAGLAFVQAPASPRCIRITAKGCTIPPMPNQQIIVKFVDPDGNPVYHTVTTDSLGCYEDFLVTVKDGNWKVEAEYVGDKCQGPAQTPPRDVSVPGGGGFVPDGPGLNGWWYSFHLGHNFPLGSLGKQYNSGPSLTADLEYQIRNRYSIYGMLGYHYFDSDLNQVRDLFYTNLSLDFRAYFPVQSWRGYVQAGPGVYFPNFGPTRFGLNFGTGLSFQLQQKLFFELGTDLHYVQRPGENHFFVDPKMGLKFRF